MSKGELPRTTSAQLCYRATREEPGDSSVGHAQKGLLGRLNAQTRSSGFTAVPTASVKEPRASEQLYGSFS